MPIFWALDISQVCSQGFGTKGALNNPNGKLPKTKEVQHVNSQTVFCVSKCILHKKILHLTKSAHTEEYVVTQEVLHQKLHDKSSMTAKLLSCSLHHDKSTKTGNLQSSVLSISKGL